MRRLVSLCGVCAGDVQELFLDSGVALLVELSLSDSHGDALPGAHGTVYAHTNAARGRQPDCRPFCKRSTDGGGLEIVAFDRGDAQTSQTADNGGTRRAALVKPGECTWDIAAPGASRHHVEKGHVLLSAHRRPAEAAPVPVVAAKRGRLLAYRTYVMSQIDDIARVSPDPERGDGADRRGENGGIRGQRPWVRFANQVVDSSDVPKIGLEVLTRVKDVENAKMLRQ